MLSSAYNRITSLATLARIVERPGFSDARISRFVVAPAAPLPHPLPLVANEGRFVDSWVGQSHAADHGQAARDVSCYFSRNIGVSGRGHLYVDHALILSDEFVPNYWRDLIVDTASPNIDEERALPERVVDTPTLVVFGHGIEVYGHFLIETLPKLMIARNVLGPIMSDLRILIEASAPNWLIRILTDVFEIRPDQFIAYNAQRERVLLRHAIMPTLAGFDGWFHPFYNVLIEDTIRLAGIEAESIRVPRLFVSRALYRDNGPMGRRCTNELRLAEIAVRDFGFALVAPETFPWRTQIGLFRNASCIVGEFGSALHAALFAHPGTVVGAIGLANMTQTMIGALRRHHNAYLRLSWDEQARGKVDEHLFRAFIESLLGHDAAVPT